MLCVYCVVIWTYLNENLGRKKGNKSHRAMVLYCTVLYCTALYCQLVLYCTVMLVVSGLQSASCL